MSFQFQTRFETLVEYYGLDMVRGVILSGDLVPKPELLNRLGFMDMGRKNSDVLRVHLQNMVSTYGQDVFTHNINFLLGLGDYDIHVF